MDAPPRSQLQQRIGPAPWPGLAGAASAGLALALTELFAGLFGDIPSAVSSIGAVIVERAPTFAIERAIDVFGTADKGALALLTSLIVVLLGIGVGRGAARRPWVAPVAFGAAGLAGFVAALDRPDIDGFATLLAYSVSVVVGVRVLRRLLGEPLSTAQPTDGLPADRSKRLFLASVAGAGAAALVAGAGGRWLIIDRSDNVRSSIAFPPPKTTVPPPGPEAFFDVPGLESIVVSNKDFYRIDTALIVPRPNPDTWRLSITGLVDREIEITLTDLMAMDLHEEYVTIACVSNKVGDDLVGNAKWTGVYLTDVFDLAGVRPVASQVVGRSVDGWTAGFPTDVVFDGRKPMIAIGMNDEVLPPRHGFPARLIVPGLYGYVSATKWLDEIELTTWDEFDGYWIPRGWSKSGPIKTQSRIDVPRRRELVNGSPTVFAGVAWAPLKGIEKVEVRVDFEGWQEAEIATPLSDKAWVHWRLERQVSSGGHTVAVRATDGTGTTQTEEITPPPPSGATGWHTIEFRAS